MYYQCKHFKIYELVDKTTHVELGERAWMLFRPDALITLDKVRKYFDQEIIINNWHSGGSLSQCGFRSYDSNVGARYSQHRLGNAFDLHFTQWGAENVRTEILSKKDNDSFKLIMAIEDSVNWLHFDCRNVVDRIMLVKPN